MSQANIIWKLGGITLASLGMFLLYKAQKEVAYIIDDSKFSKQQLMLILEDLRMEYTPFYLHYYHSLAEIIERHSDNQILIEQVKLQFKQKLDEKVKDIHRQIVKKYTLESEAHLHSWITQSLDDPLVKYQIEILDNNDERLFGDKLLKPDFQLSFPPDLNKYVVIKIMKKVLASQRHIIYKEIRNIVRNRKQASLSKEEMKTILSNLNIQEIRSQVFQMYGLPEPSPRQPSHRILQKAHYTFMSEPDYLEEVYELKSSHDRFMTAILQSDIFAGLDTKVPIDYSEDDEIPKKFYSYYASRGSKESSESIDDNSQNEAKILSQVAEKDTKQIQQLELHLEQQERLLFTEIKIRVRQQE